MRRVRGRHRRRQETEHDGPVPYVDPDAAPMKRSEPVRPSAVEHDKVLALLDRILERIEALEQSGPLFDLDIDVLGRPVDPERPQLEPAAEGVFPARRSQKVVQRHGGVADLLGGYDSANKRDPQKPAGQASEAHLEPVGCLIGLTDVAERRELNTREPRILYSMAPPGLEPSVLLTFAVKAR